MKDFVMYLCAPVLAIFYLAMVIALALWYLLVAIVALIIVLPARLMPSPIDDKMYKLFEYIIDHGDPLKKILEPPPAKDMIIFIGIPASGKTTFYQQNFAEKHVHISLDILHTRNREANMLKDTLISAKSCVIDNTNVSVAERAKYIETGKRYGYKVIGYYFRSSIDECRIRNDRRQGRKQVPEVALRNKAAHLEHLSMQEGFDELYYVKIVDDKFEITQYNEG